MINFRLDRRVKVLKDAEYDCVFVMRVYGPGEILFPGDIGGSDVRNRYGKWCAQFYVADTGVRTDLGKFSGSSYYISTLLEGIEQDGIHGLRLAPGWAICPETYAGFIEFLKDFMAELEASSAGAIADLATRTWESPTQAMNAIKELPVEVRLNALAAIVQQNVEWEELGFSSELINEVHDNECDVFNIGED